MTLRACAARARTRLAGEGGFGVIEVLVSALIVVLISLSTLAAIDAAGRTQDTNKSRRSPPASPRTTSSACEP